MSILEILSVLLILLGELCIIISIIGVFRIYDKTYYDNSIDRPPAGACIYRARKEATE